ncbi:MAG: MBL fold metallo-hydrolase [Patescibacteria group bacterium]|nr:MBL fold metallo-hydrolase [Patescibacteria group bacterium]
MNHLKRNLQFVVSIFAIVIFVFLIGRYSRPQASSDLKVYFLNVGQGDAEYIKTPSGQDILIDGGPDTSVLNELGKVMDFGDREINLVILSHPHADHLTGLLEVINRFKVDEVWETGVEYPSSTYDLWRQEIFARKIPDKIVKAGDSKDFGETKIKILYPLSPLQNSKIDNLNNASVVNRLDYKKFSVLFMGDLEKDFQTKILNENLFATVLKVAHHGSSNGLSENLLKVVRPALAIIEVGKDNTYGHPASSIINLLKKYAVRIYRTDQNGTIEIDSDGEGYWVKN